MPFSRIVDLTHTFSQNMPVSKFDDSATIQQVKTLDKDYYNDYQINSGMHVGTHIDGRAHLLPIQASIASEPVEHFVGSGVLIDVRNKYINKSLLDGIKIESDSIVLILTGKDKEFGTKDYFENYPEISEDFAQELINAGVKMIGIDTFSPDSYPFAIHKMLLENNILIIENLRGLDQLVGVKDFTVVALPLKIEADSGLARVIALIR